MDGPAELSLAEIRNFMVANDFKVTNHSLVKHFKKFLTNPDTQNEARKQFKTYVNILATIKNEKNQKYLILREKYITECPSEDIVNRGEIPMSPGSDTGSTSDFLGTPPFRRVPPPYKPPPEVSPTSSAVKIPVLQDETKENYRDCVNEFQVALSRIVDSNRVEPEITAVDNNVVEKSPSPPPPMVPPRKRSSVDRSGSRENFADDNKENVAFVENSNNHETEPVMGNAANASENQISVKEVTRKFNRMASEEEAKVISPSSKKKPEMVVTEEKLTTDETEEKTPEVTLAHPEARKWIVIAAKADYQELAKLSSKHPELVKLQDPTTTALHWAAKHGNEDVVKLIAGTYKANVNARTNGGYTPLHLAVQYGKDDVFELLCNVYKADRDLTDWSGNKPLDYSKQSTTVSASTYSKIKARRKHSEKDLGFLRIGSLNVRVKKTTEAFSNFLGVGGGNTNSTYNNNNNNNSNHNNNAMRNPHHHHHQHSGMTQRMMTTNRVPAHLRTSAVPMNKHFDKLKSWGSADNIPHDHHHSTTSAGAAASASDNNNMPPPKNSASIKKQRSKRKSDYDITGYNSMPTTPNQLRAPIGILSENPKGDASSTTIDSDSDSACGFGSNWSMGRNE